MESKIALSLKLKFPPIAVLWTDLEPDKAAQFGKGKWGCAMFMLATAAKGRTAMFDRETAGCWGGAVGLGFGNFYERWPGGIDCFYKFLSTGNQPSEKSQKVMENLSGRLSREGLDNFLNGERYVKTPEQAKKFVEALPITDVPTKFVVFKPLAEADLEKEEPAVIVFLANPDQISALTVMFNYETDGDRLQNVIVPAGAGCHQIGIIPLHESKSEHPRAVIGMTDISARNNVKRRLGHDLLSFAVPLKLFLKMEGNVEGSFLERHSWKELAGEQGEE